MHYVRSYVGRSEQDLLNFCESYMRSYNFLSSRERICGRTIFISLTSCCLLRYCDKLTNGSTISVVSNQCLRNDNEVSFV